MSEIYSKTEFGNEGFTYFRYLLVAPFTFVALSLFALYFTGRNKWGIRKENLGRWAEVLWGAVVGLPMVLCNVTYNWVCGTFIFLEFPPTRDPDDGEFSIFFTNRLKTYQRLGKFPNMTFHLTRAINEWDEGHFDMKAAE